MVTELFVCDHPNCEVLDLVFLSGAPVNNQYLCSYHHPAKKKWHGEFDSEKYDASKHIVLNRTTGLGLS